MQELVKNTIHNNQVGFMSKIWGWANICKSIKVIRNINRLKNINNLTVSLDTEKIFDKTQHPFMIQVLGNLGP